MTPRTSRAGLAIVLPLLLLMIVFPGLASAEPGAEPGPLTPLSPELQTLADALADSVDARCSSGTVRLIETRDGTVRIDRGSAGGLRPYSRLTLVSPDGAPWVAEIDELGESSARLKPAPGSAGGAAPAAGRDARIRIDVGRVAMSPPRITGGDDVDRQLADALVGRLAGRLSDRHALAVVDMPDYPDSAEWREVATAAGADVAVRAAVRFENGRGRLTLALRELRRDRDFGLVVAVLPAAAAEYRSARPAIAAPRPDPPPGLRATAVTDPMDGSILDLLVRRWLWSDALLVFGDRIEAWSVGGRAPTRRSVTDLASLWPLAVPTRWPVAEMLPVNTYYDMTGAEARVNYSLCSNQRPRYLTINIEKAVPESLNLVVSDGPLDTLSASPGGCFQQVHRVAVPAGFAADPAMPKTAVARLGLDEILRDRAGRPLRTESGQLRRKKVAVVLHDEATATLWLSTPAGGHRLPGNFGTEMDGYRAGLAGPPGFLVTSAADPGRSDHLEWWLFEGGRCERRWKGADLPGAITAILCGDRDGDERDDLVMSEVMRHADGYRSRLYAFGSQPDRGMAP